MPSIKKQYLLNHQQIRLRKVAIYVTPPKFHLRKLREACHASEFEPPITLNQCNI
ncbi:hypothetical protein Hanom_Chr04g00368581 [Helianthus anomalus]